MKPYDWQTDWSCPATSSSVTPPHERGHRFRHVVISDPDVTYAYLYCERCGRLTADREGIRLDDPIDEPLPRMPIGFENTKVPVVDGQVTLDDGRVISGLKSEFLNVVTPVFEDDK